MTLVYLVFRLIAFMLACNNYCECSKRALKTRTSVDRSARRWSQRSHREL